MSGWLQSLQSGQRSGPAASVGRVVLSTISAVYGAGRWLHRFVYRAGLLRRGRLPVPVVSIGNLTTGGSGKTPFVAWLARRLIARGLRPAVLARGYGRAPGELWNDEGLWLRREIPEMPVLQGPDRESLARAHLGVQSCDVFLLDDGFQHERLERDLDLVLIDATLPFGYGRLLPRGLLREPPAGLRRAHLAIVTRREQIDDAEAGELFDRIRALAPAIETAAARFPLAGVRGAGGLLPAAVLRGARVHLLCAVGNPRSVRRSLESSGALVRRCVAFRDHHRFVQAEVDEGLARARSDGARLVVTAKDAVKIEPLAASAGDDLWVLQQDVVLEDEAGALERLLTRCLASR